MKVNKYQRGQIWWYENNSSFDGSVQGKTRPMIIISNNLANQFSNNLIAVPCTTAPKKEMPTHVQLDIGENKSTALCENIMSVNTKRLDTYIGTCDEELMAEIDNCVKISLGLIEIPKNNTIIQNDFPDEQCESKEENIVTLELPNINQINEEESSKKKITIHDKIRFINDYENHNTEFMLEKYNIANRHLLAQRAYLYRKAIKEANQ